MQTNLSKTRSKLLDCVPSCLCCKYYNMSIVGTVIPARTVTGSETFRICMSYELYSLHSASHWTSQLTLNTINISAVQQSFITTTTAPLSHRWLAYAHIVQQSNKPCRSLHKAGVSTDFFVDLVKPNPPTPRLTQIQSCDLWLGCGWRLELVFSSLQDCHNVKPS